jgi:hypothetical protein
LCIDNNPVIYLGPLELHSANSFDGSQPSPSLYSNQPHALPIAEINSYHGDLTNTATPRTEDSPYSSREEMMSSTDFYHRKSHKSHKPIALGSRSSRSRQSHQEIAVTSLFNRSSNCYYNSSTSLLLLTLRSLLQAHCLPYTASDQNLAITSSISSRSLPYHISTLHSISFGIQSQQVPLCSTRFLDVFPTQSRDSSIMGLNLGVFPAFLKFQVQLTAQSRRLAFLNHSSIILIRLSRRSQQSPGI